MPQSCNIVSFSAQLWHTSALPWGPLCKDSLRLHFWHKLVVFLEEPLKLPSPPISFIRDELLDLLLEGIGPISKSRSLLFGCHAALLIELLNAPPCLRDAIREFALSRLVGDCAPCLLRIYSGIGSSYSMVGLSCLTYARGGLRRFRGDP